MGSINCLAIFFKIFAFVFNRGKQFIQIWDNLRVSKLENFLVNYPVDTAVTHDIFQFL